MHNSAAGSLVDSAEVDDSTSAILPPHPLGVRPAGNAYTTSINLRTASGRFSRLTDELINEFLEYLDGRSLVQAGATCKALYAFSRSEDLWKTLFLESSSQPPRAWRGTWRSTYLNLSSSHESHVSCVNLFSDLLYRPFQCAHISLIPYTTSIPAANRISRFPNLTPMEFASTWVNTPFILTDPVRKWPIYEQWSLFSLVERYGETQFRAEAVDWPLEVYRQYMDDNSDESPLYLFDRGFVEKMGLKATNAVDGTGDYWTPECFGEDLFAVLAEERPDSRWLIIGPERSGSTFHKDPNATSAWNAVVRGAKYWIMFPSSDTSSPPPGVFVSDDQSEVTSPLSIAEWLFSFHAEARKTKGCIEGICNEGEVLHVPSGWWHLVVNLSPSIAITQNFIPRAHLAAALLFLRDKPDQVSGFAKHVTDPYHIFLQRLREQHPHVLEDALAAMSLVKEGGGKKRKWDELVRGRVEHTTGDADTDGEGGGGLFSFGFEGDDADDDDNDDGDVPYQ